MARCAPPGFAGFRIERIERDDASADPAVCAHACSATTSFSHGRNPPSVNPPSTRMLCPVTNRASSDSSHATASATSSGRLVPLFGEYELPSRPMQIVYLPDNRSLKLRSFVEFALQRFGG
ncbi:hypothetical protein WI36_12040 [Burkholderia ubonensis]|nr:hypothetical protein WI36_12040 [Burkholderia ubonensis]KVA22789.1 hypothetical protein WI43_13880 [Burkholderia ubonensis]KVA24164.1 hypothetical protein WI42_06350 [Burkholderia ubonensis]KVA49171.1 hypothetical protein WI46_02245 [Burkholderia ubonensis]